MDNLLVIAGGIVAFIVALFGARKMGAKDHGNHIRAEAAEKRVEDKEHVKKLKQGYEEMSNGRIRDTVTKRWVRKDDAYE